MLQCPYCDHRTFTTSVTTYTEVELTGLEDGDYREKETKIFGHAWGTLQCARCGWYVDEADAKACFETATLADNTTDAIYDWYDQRMQTRMTVAEEESCLSIAGAWNLFVWKQDGGYGPA